MSPAPNAAPMPAILLSIDTAGTRCAVALCDMETGEVLALAEPDIGRGHAEVLIGLVDQCLATAGVVYADIGKIAVVVGPGSFTGLRVGVAAAKGLALALGVPALGISSLEALAEPHIGAGRPVLAVIDAKRNEVYAALFAADGRVLAEPQALDPQDLPAFVELAGAEDGDLLIAGSGAAIAAAALPGVPTETVNPAGDTDIAAVARLGRLRPAGAPVRPLYLRGADAKPAAATGISHVPAAASLP